MAESWDRCVSSGTGVFDSSMTSGALERTAECVKELDCGAAEYRFLGYALLLVTY